MDKQARTINDISGAEFLSGFPAKYKLRLEDDYPFLPKLMLEIHTDCGHFWRELSTDAIFAQCSPSSLVKDIGDNISEALQDMNEQTCARITEQVSALREIINDADTLRAIPDTPF